MIDKILSCRNIREACKQVVSKQGSAGVDGMSVKALPEYLKANQDCLTTAIVSGQYLPQFILGVEIPKENGKTRLLGIPTVVDRVLQQAVHQVISPPFELEFKEHSYGFRPNRSAHQAVQQAQKNIHDGYDYIVDIDLKNFFDEVDHGILLELLYAEVKCPVTLRLIRKWLTVPILINGKLVKRRKGVPQGSPLSPLLSNVMLHELDKELEKRGHRYVRYADDFSVYTKSNKGSTSSGEQYLFVLKEQIRATHQSREKRHSQTSAISASRASVCIHVSERGQRQISSGGHRQEMEVVETGTETDHQKNCPTYP